ncbi:hypothetical protein CANCADRAFT_141233 [Tortispora caseinolytica NRRL Y-17796]|uniref:Mitochondrial thiamine pyrophosphate carrier 1 n=1 Tax=Tortispora caseinolytica NRRL Y-17796 TaxID=767744 RepID=A0A1E4TCW7_9ASCO|nr:hypothetical protein CANCADRAFT_141233 [Tortispora caseinolytica NRRL Y-17796]
MKKDNHVAAHADIEAYESSICGAVSGLISRFFVSPLDVIKISMQLRAASDHSRTLYSTVIEIFEKEGLTAFWKGNLSAEILYSTYGLSQFYTYRLVNRTLKDFEIGSTSNFLAGSIAALSATLITYPFDLLRTRFVAQSTHNKAYHSLRHAVTSIYRQDGLQGFFKGASLSLITVSPYMGIFFWTYGMLYDIVNGTFLPPEATAGFFAGGFAKAAVYPLDTVRRFIQVQGANQTNFSPHPKLHSYLETVRYILRENGVQGLYRGLPVSVIKAAPASALTMWSFELSLTTLRKITGKERALGP